MRTFPYIVADVFTATPLQGNQLGVFPEPGNLDSGEMQALAREMNFAECVFLVPPTAGGDARIRIFSPSRELPFAGHPVIGTAVVLGEQHDGSSITIETGIGPVTVDLERVGTQITLARLTQAAPEAEPYERADELRALLGVEPFGLPVEAYRNGPRHVFLEFPTDSAMSALAPDMKALSGHDIAVECFAGSGRHWGLRMFAPSIGIPEDPATGSAAGPLALHLSRHDRIAPGAEIEIHQGAEMNRPSVLYGRTIGSGGQVERIEVAGQAVVVARGEFRFP